jgi:membrane-associated phospholipid phosphatase
MSTTIVPSISPRPAGLAPRAPHTSGSVAPVLDAQHSRSAGALAAIAGPTHPVRTFLAGVLVAYAAIAGVSILLGLLVTRVVVANRGLAGDDESFIRFLSHHRTADLTDASLIGSIMAGGVVLPILVGVLVLAAAAFRQWRVAGFVLFALAIESAAYRTTTLVIHRDRPPVHRLEQLPVNASYPSGHTAASIAVYCGLALLITSRIAGRLPRFAIWAVVVAIPVFVALSRMYRGMHHPLDVLGGTAIGIATIAALVLASRAAGISTAIRDGREPEPGA